MIASLNEVLADPLLKGKDPVVVDIQNISDYSEETNAEGQDISSIPCVAPPWSDALLTFNLYGTDTAIFVTHQKHDAGWDVEFRMWFPELAKMLGALPSGFIPKATMSLDSMGKIKLEGTKIRYKRPTIIFGTGFPEEQIENADKHLDAVIRGVVLRAFMAFGFAHCKNVSTMAVALPRSLRRRMAREDSTPKTKVYTLNIKPMQKVLATQGQVGSVGIKQALHICRGHFKTYAEGKGLFGKLHGTYWWPQMVRGDQQHGVINKKYNVEVA
jgi:hypothetical protein